LGRDSAEIRVDVEDEHPFRSHRPVSERFQIQTPRFTRDHQLHALSPSADHAIGVNVAGMPPPTFELSNIFRRSSSW
jgi:hypothetical protein